MAFSAASGERSTHDAAGGGAGHEGLDLGAGGEVGVADDGVAEAGGSGGEGEGLGGIAERGGVEGEDESGGKGIARANAVDDVFNLVGIELAVAEGGEGGGIGGDVVEHGAPVVVRGGDAFAQGHGDAGEIWEALGESAGHGKGGGGRGFLTGFEAEDVSSGAVVGDKEVHMLEDGGHDFAGEFGGRGAGAPGPEFTAEVEIADDVEAAGFGFGGGAESGGGGELREAGGDAGEEEGAGVRKDFFPVVGVGGGEADGGVFAIVDDVAGALVGAVFVVVEAETAVVGAQDVGDVDAETGVEADAGVGDGVARQSGDEADGGVELGERGGDVGFGAADIEIHRAGDDLAETEDTGGGEAAEEFAERDDGFHF